MLHDGFKLSSEEVLEHFGTDAINGLNYEKVLINQCKYGLNGN